MQLLNVNQNTLSLVCVSIESGVIIVCFLFSKISVSTSASKFVCHDLDLTDLTKLKLDLKNSWTDKASTFIKSAGILSKTVFQMSGNSLNELKRQVLLICLKNKYMIQSNRITHLFCDPLVLGALYKIVFILFILEKECGTIIKVLYLYKKMQL